MRRSEDIEMRECDGVRYCDVCVRMVEIEMMMRGCEGDRCCDMCASAKWKT